MKKKNLMWLMGIGILSTMICFLMASLAMANDSEANVTTKTLAEDIYDLSMSLKVPQVQNNTTSNGYRKFTVQKIKGKMYIVWKSDGTFQIEFSDLVNKNFKVRGVNVTYEGYQDESVYPRFNFIGNNKTGNFTTPCICFSVVLEPSYALGGATEDNSFILVMSAKGTAKYKKNLGCTIATTLSGYVAGHQGCGCMDYGHKSPTRNATICGPGSGVSDVVATFGIWKAKWKGRRCCK